MKALKAYIILIYIISNTFYLITPAQAQDLKHPIDNLKELVVSENFGSVRDSYFAGNNNGIIIHIQDLHCNYDAQMSIYHIIDELIEKYGLDLVTVEGSVGRLETAPFSNYPNEEIKEEVAKYFVKTGELDGAAFAHIMRKSGFTFWGADDRQTYLDNVEAYKASIESESINERYYNNMKSILAKFKSKVYSPELKEIDDKMQAYKTEELDFSEYILYLKDRMDRYGMYKGDYSNLNTLIEVLRKEADIDFIQVDNERSEYIDILSKELKDAKLSVLLDKSLYFKLGKLSAVDFYTYLEGISLGKDVTPIEEYPQLTLYIDYIKLYSTIEHIALFKEIEAVEKSLKDKLFTNDTQRKIDTLSYQLEVLNDLFNLKLTKETLQYYQEHRREFLTSNFINFISEDAPRYGIRYRLDSSFRKIDAELPRLERFYQLAEERDSIIVNNTINKMREQKAKLAVLVSGGFHTKGITELLKEKELSYLVITPKVEKLQGDNPYTSVLLGEKNEFDRFYDMVMKTKK